MCTPERQILRAYLPSMLVTETETVGNDELDKYARVVALSVTEKATVIPDCGEAYLALSEIVQQAGQSTIGKGKRFFLKFMAACFKCVNRVHVLPIENIFAGSCKDSVVAFTMDTVKADKKATLPTTQQRTRKGSKVA